MIYVEIVRGSDQSILSISAKDHSGMAPEGSDIVCAGVSTLMYTAIGAIQTICGSEGFYTVREGSDRDTVPRMTVRLPKGLDPDQKARAGTILATIRVGLFQLEESVRSQYGDQFLTVHEVTRHVGGVNND